MISIHAPPRGATHRICPWLAKKLISIHAPPRGATNRRDARPAVPTFQFTPLREGRHARLARHQRLFRHFNSRPSARGDASARNVPRKPLISIHAPPRGATTAKPQGLGAFQFQFTPLREGRPFVAFRQRFPCKFQFTPLREGRQVVHKPQKTAVLFQFTPLREGRRYTRATSWIQSNFNSRPSARGDANVQPLLLGNKFQFTPLREGRQRSSRQIRRACYFNSRPSARGDSTKSRASSGSTNFNSRPSARGDFCSSGRTWVSAISIHAPPRGATRGVRNSLGDKIFQFTPLREGRRLRFLHAPHSLLFQFTPLREGRPRSCPALPRGEHFNSRPSARGDLEARPFLPQPIYFNSRPSARGDRAPSPCRPRSKRISIHAPPRGAT